MNYRISYYSPQGHAKELAYAFRRILPSQTPVVDLSVDAPLSCDVHLIGFEYQEPKFDKIPQQIQEFLSKLEYKDILLFATCPVRTDENLRMQIERSMVPFLSKNCKYHGLFLCQGEVYLTVLEDVFHQTEEKTECEDAKLLLREYRKGKGHPNREDVRKGWRFIATALQL